MTYQPWDRNVIYAVAIVTTLLFFTAALIHELSPAMVARRRGLPVHSITLFMLGGRKTKRNGQPEGKFE